MSDQTFLDPSNIPATDHSKNFLDGLFGSGWNLPGGMGEITDVTTLIFDLFGAFNSVAMFIAAAILGLSLYKGLVGTAQEGEFLGRRMNSFYAPMRSALAISMLAPVFKGLCAIQLIVLLCIGGSINLANSMWLRALDFLHDNTGQYHVVVSDPMPAALDNSTKKLAKGILKSLAIQHYQQLFEEKTVPNPYVRVVTQPMGVRPHETRSHENIKKSYYQIIFRAPESRFFGISDDEMGRIIIDHKTGKMHDIRLDATKQLIADLDPLAQSIVYKMHPDYDITIDKSILENAINRYNNTIFDNLDAALNATNPDYQEKLDAFINEAEAGGWFLAGTYYWNIVNFSNMMSEMIQSEPVYNDGDEKLLLDLATSELPPILESVKIVSEQIEEKMSIARNSASSGTGMQKRINDWTYDHFGKIGVGALIKGLVTGDVMINLSNLGHVLVKISYSSLLAGITANALPGGILDGLSYFFLAVSLSIFMMGAFLAFYLPVIPFVTWTFALVGWLVVIIESMFAAPLWAVAHSLPEGEGFAGQYGRTGYMMLFGVLVRPPLMVAGLLCAMVCLPLFAKFLGASFLIFHASMSDDNTFGVVSTFAFIVLGGSLFVIVAQKFFGLITWLPEHVTAWVGQQVQNLGEGQDESKTRMAMAAAAGGGGVGGAVTGGLQRAKRRDSGGSNDDGGNDDGSGGGGSRPRANMSAYMPADEK